MSRKLFDDAESLVVKNISHGDAFSAGEVVAHEGSGRHYMGERVAFEPETNEVVKGL